LYTNDRRACNNIYSLQMLNGKIGSETDTLFTSVHAVGVSRSATCLCGCITQNQRTTDTIGSLRRISNTKYIPNCLCVANAPTQDTTVEYVRRLRHAVMTLRVSEITLVGADGGSKRCVVDWRCRQQYNTNYDRSKL